jgi:hypothetical protein
MIKKNGRRGTTRFVLCIESGEYAASLERRKLYEVLPDPDAERHGQLRVIDESGEDYLYPRTLFRLVDLSPSLERLIRDQRTQRVGSARSRRTTDKIRTAR